MGSIFRQTEREIGEDRGLFEAQNRDIFEEV
jgi:hypothetical protein